MKKLLILLLVSASLNARAQDIPFIRKETLQQWLNADTDTVYVLNFWATWCAPCVEELPAFEKIHKEYASKKVKVVLISTDFKRNVESKLKPFVKRKNLQSQVVFMDEPNPNNWVNMVSPDWSGALPATLIVHKRKDIALFFEKQLNYETLEEIIQRLTVDGGR
ncbi:MAG: redoxin domain-containing protein [Saprospiraceae bacterium]|nr:redoxin domain-containing protein [Saprospiraceae bacterium]